jgi:hypothetical protein
MWLYLLSRKKTVSESISFLFSFHPFTKEIGETEKKKQRGERAA